jgi:hypothetical protein
MKANDKTIGGIVDRLAIVKQQIADAQAEELKLRQLLIDSGLSAIDGIYHRATVSETDGKLFIDWKSIAMKFNPSRQLIKAHSSTGDSYYTVRVTARKTS